MERDGHPPGMPPPERWRQVTALFHATVARAPGERDVFLATACGDDAELRDEVRRLVTAHDESLPFGSAPIAVAPAHLPAGTWVGPYCIEQLVGVGGMGEVYRAHDSKLDRAVALKVLPSDVGVGAGHVTRFATEARLLGALNHPNIGAIYGLHDSGAIRALILEFVEGETLASRLDAGPLPVNDAIGLAIQVAEALEAAHARGIVHRDLKPANVMVTRGGTVKVLDFGLAKAVDPQAPGPGLSTPFMAMGTAPYMSPEQARGLSVDTRTDIWAFGCLLYELLTGRPAFSGSSPADVLANIAAAQPDLEALPPATPARIRTLIARCLRKDASRRLRDIGDARIELEAALHPSSPVPTSAGHRRPRRAWQVAALVTGAIAIGAAWAATRPTPARSEMAPHPVAFAINPPEGVLWGQLPPDPQPAVSPDGQKVAFVGRAADGLGIWVRDLRDVEARRVGGTEGFPDNLTGTATGLFWSHDSTQLAYCADGHLRIIAFDGRPPRSIDADCIRGDSSWNASGEILLARDDGIYRVSDRGGSPTRETTVDGSRDMWHRYPQWLPGARRFIFTVISADAAVAGIYVATLGNPETRRLLPAPSRAQYVTAPDGRAVILFVAEAKLIAQPVDPDGLTLRGNPQVLAGEMSIGPAGFPSFSGSTSLLVHRSGGALTRSSWVRVDRAGRLIDDLPDATTATSTAALSPDGTTLVYSRRNRETMMLDLWMRDFARRVERPLIVRPWIVDLPAFSHDGRRLAFTGGEGGRLLTYTMDFPSGVPTRVLTPRSVTGPLWLNDGRTMVATERGSRIVEYDLDRPDKVRVLVEEANQPAVSPDGQWLAYTSSISGVPEVYVQPYAGGRVPVRVSARGGFQPQWRGDGTELFYLNEAGDVMAVPVSPARPFTDHEARRLFRARFRPEGAGYLNRDYLATRDGHEFLLNVPTSGPVPLTAIRDWMAALK